MKNPILLLLVCLAFGCDQPAPNKPDIAYTVINARNESGTQFYDIFLKDTAAIKPLNVYLKDKYNSDHRTWIEINYYNDSTVAKTYFAKQFDPAISDKVKDRLFKNFIANYKFNPSTGYDTLVYEH